MKKQQKNAKDKDDKKKINNKENNLLPKNPNTREHLSIINESEILNFESNQIKENLIFAKPCEIFSEWPSEDELKHFNNQMLNDKIEQFFDKDNEKIKFPNSLESSFQNNIKWLRPHEFVRNFMIQKEIKDFFPNKQVAKMKHEVNDYYYSIELLLRKISDCQKNNNFILKKDLYIDNNNTITSNEEIDFEQNDKDNHQIEYFDNDNLDKYEDYVLDTVNSETLNHFNDYNTNAFHMELHSNKPNKVIDKNIVIYEGRESFNIKRNVYKSFFKYFEKQQNYKIVKILERNESEEEIKHRLEEESKSDHLRDNKHTKATQQNINNSNLKLTQDKNFQSKINFNELEKANLNESQKIKEINPSNLYLSANHNIPAFSKWISSILQLISDLHLLDVNTERNILFNIYPQKDNFPVVSPSGRYWIKLYFMGKPRKIEIDDRIPCNKYDDFILPRCENLDEIWPALFTKALLKLYSYKFLHGSYNELADLSFVYSLLGLHAEKVKMNSSKIKYLDNFLNNQENNNLTLNEKISTFACMNFSEEDIKKNAPNNNPNSQLFKRNFNFNFKVLDPDKDIMDTSMAKFSVKSKLTHHDSFHHKVSKPRFSNVISKIFSVKKNGNSGSSKPLFKSMGDVFLKKSILSDKQINIPEKIEKEEGKDLNIDESVINLNFDHKHKKNETIDSENNLLANMNLISSNVSNIQSQTNVLQNALLHKSENKILEKENEGSIISKKQAQERSSEKYRDFVSKLKTYSLRKKANLFNSSKVLKIIDFSSSKTEFKSDDNNKMQKANQPDGLIKSIVRSNKKIQTSCSLVKIDDIIANNDALKRNDILNNFAYSILDFFDNKKYNMDRLKPLEFSDLKKIVKDAQPQGVYKRLSAAEKKKYLSNLLEMKNKQIEIKNKRIDDIKKEGKHLFFIRLKNDTIGIPKFDFYIPFCDYDIYIVKLCILNNWLLPPPSYYIERYPKNEEEKVEENPIAQSNHKLESSKIEEKKTKGQSSKKIKLSNIEENVETNMNNETNICSPNSKQNVSDLNNQTSIKRKKQIFETMHQLVNDNTDYSLPYKEPSSKFSGGNWVNYSDFKRFFNSCLFFYNPKKFRNILNLDNNWIYNHDCFEFNYDFSIIYLYKDNSMKQIIEDESIEFSTMIVFEANNGLTDKSIDVTYYVNFDLVDSSTGKPVQETIHLSNFYSNVYLENMDKKKNYFLVLKSFLCPFGFNMKLMSDFNMDNINFNTYLKKFGNFHSKNFNLEHMVIEKNKNYLLVKFSLKVTERTRFKIIISHPDSLSKNYIEIFLLYGKTSYKKRKIAFNNQEVFTLEPIPNDLHYFVFLINPPYNIRENSFEIEFLHTSENFILETLDYIEPYKFEDRFVMNKYGIIFKEQCSETVYAMLEISIKKLFEETNKNLNNHKVIGGGQSINNINKLLNDNSEKSRNHHNNIIDDLEGIYEKLRMNVKIIKNNEVLLEEEFYNQILIRNFIFEHPHAVTLTNTQDQKNNNNKNSTNQSIHLQDKELYTYYIICSFDLSEIDKHKQIIEKNLSWEVRIFSTDYLYFSKDTSKEDREKTVKDSWEQNEKGRSELAKTSRLRFLGLNKKSRGEALSPSEEIIINTERIKKFAFSYDNFFKKDHGKENQKKLSIAPIDNKLKSPSKNNNPQLKGKNILSSPDPSSFYNEYAKYEKLELRPITIRPEAHKSYYIKNFVNYTIKDRTVTKGQYVPFTQKKILNDELRKRKIEQIDKNFYNFEFIKKTENDEKQNNPDNLKLFYKTTSSFRQQSREGSHHLMRQRDYIRGKMERLIDYERNINEILLNNNNNDINYITNIYTESLSIDGLNSNLRSNLYKFISNKKNEFYHNELNKLTAKDKNTIIKYIDDLKTSNFDLDHELIDKFQAILIEPPKPKK